MEAVDAGVQAQQGAAHGGGQDAVMGQPAQSQHLLLAIPAEEQGKLLAKLDPELSFLWAKLEIPLEVQARISQLGFFDVDI